MGNDKSLKRKYNAESKNIKNLIIGIVNIVIALVVYLWASNIHHIWIWAKCY